MTATSAVTKISDTKPIELRSPPPAHLQTSVQALLETFASSSTSEDVTIYLPDDFLTILAG